MRFRADWLQDVLTVPYVPTLGPVHPDVFDPELFEMAIAASKSGRILPFDKDRRWGGVKDEVVLADEITHERDFTVIPTMTRRLPRITLYCYGRQIEVSAERLRVGHAGAAVQRVWFDNAGTSASTRVMLTSFDGGSVAVPGIRLLEIAERPAFAEFAAEIGPRGFDFLHRRFLKGHSDGPMLCAFDSDRIVGAIGPLTVMPDRHGRPALMPQYFGVLPTHRRHGIGRALWRATAHWARRNRAAYQILQAECGKPAEQLFLSEGFTTLGFVSKAGIAKGL